MTPIIKARASDATYTEACYWLITAEQNQWREDSHIWVYFDESVNADLYVYAGNSRSNWTDANEGGVKVTIGAPVRVRSDEGVIVVMKSDGTQQTANGIFSYKVDGVPYTWYEKPWIGKHLFSYYLFLIVFWFAVWIFMIIPGLIIASPGLTLVYIVFTLMCPCIGLVPCC